MVFGAHLVLYSRDADADRRFLTEHFGLRSIDAGHGWLIFEMPPAEVAVHPGEAPAVDLFLRSDPQLTGRPLTGRRWPRGHE